MAGTNHCEIGVLGTLTVSVDGRLLDPISGRAVAGVLVVLALAGRRGCTADGLLRSLHHPRTGGQLVQSGNALEKHIGTLRRLGIPIPKRGQLHSRGYALDWSRTTVDADRFVEGVNSGKAAELLGSWREDPRPLYPQVAEKCWAPVLTARDALVTRLEGLEPWSVPGLADFTDLFPDDPALDVLRRRVRRKRLLVVEDQNIDLYLDALRSDYECVPVRNLQEWLRHLKENGDRLDVHGALIDLHLTSDMDDRQGLEIAAWLRDHTSVPAALMTMAPPAGDLEDQARLHRARYRLVRIVYKGANGLDLAGIREAASCLTGTEPHQVRARLATWLENKIFMEIDRLAKQPPTEDVRKRRAEVEETADAARLTVARNGLEKARKAVAAFPRRIPEDR